MWLQYVRDVGNAAINQANVATNASVRASLRRMSQAAIDLGIALEDESGATVLPSAVMEEREAAAAETAALPLANEATDEDGESGDEKGAVVGIIEYIVIFANMIVNLTATIAYPLALLPYYRAETTTE